MKKEPVYGLLTPELVREITRCVVDCFQKEEARFVKTRHDRKRANIILLLRRYRDIVKHVDEAVFEASQVDEDLNLQELLEMMDGTRHESFQLESMRENVATARLLVDHINKMLEIFRLSCESSDKSDDLRQYRVLHSMYIAPEVKKIEEIADSESIDKSTVYRDVYKATNRLAVLFFGVYGLNLQ